MKKGGQKAKRATGNNDEENSTRKAAFRAKRTCILGVNKTAGDNDAAVSTTAIPGVPSITNAVVGVTATATENAPIPGLAAKTIACLTASCGNEDKKILGLMEPDMGNKVRQMQEELIHATGEGNCSGMDQDNLRLGAVAREKIFPELIEKWKYYLNRCEIPEWVKADWPRVDYVKTENAMLVGFAALASYQYFFGMYKLPSKKSSQSMYESCQNRGVSEAEVVNFIENHLFVERDYLLKRIGTKKIMECRLPNWFEYLKKKAGLKGVFVLSNESLTEQKLRGMWRDHVLALMYFLPNNCDCFTKIISKKSAGNNDAANGDDATI